VETTDRTVTGTPDGLGPAGQGDTANESSGGTSGAARKGLERIAELRASGELRAERLDPLEKARRNPKSLRLAVNAKCFDCEGGNADPNVQRRIGTCSIAACPLHPVRPYQELAAGEARSRRELQLGHS
jgi:hypothetical protein